MADLPLILFPKANLLPPPKGRGGPSNLHRPSLEDQHKRLEPQFERLYQSFGRLQPNTDSISPEQVIVIEIYGRLDQFESAVRKLDLKWLESIELDELEPEFGFFNLDSKQQPKTTTPINGQLFLVMSNQRAMDKLLSLWNQWKNSKDKFPHGLGKWKELFQNLRSIERWSERHRLQDSGVLDYFSEELSDAEENDTPIPCEIELWFRSAETQRKRAETEIRALLEKLGGKLL